jgi:hypothetical protein
LRAPGKFSGFGLKRRRFEKCQDHLLGGGCGLGDEAVLHLEAVRHFFADLKLHRTACFAGSLGEVDAIGTSSPTMTRV